MGDMADLITSQDPYDEEQQRDEDGCSQRDAVICPYCNKEAEFVDSEEVYCGNSYGMIYLCRPCQAWVGVHKGTDKPLGRLADAELRGARREAHSAFDSLWQHRKGRAAKRLRGSMYVWLAEEMNLSREDCHIGKMDVQQCQRVVELCIERAWR